MSSRRAPNEPWHAKWLPPFALGMCYLGWQESLAQLATLVEPDIPG